MKPRSAAVALVAALAAAPLAMTVTASAAPAPTASTVAAASVDATRQKIEAALERSAVRLARAKESHASRAEALAPQSPDRAPAQSTDSAASALAAAAETDRIFGANRFETAVKISQDTYPDPSAGFGGVVFIANGFNFPDALAAGPAATSMMGPILLVPPTGGLPEVVEDEIRRLAPDSIAILGKADNVSAAAEADLVGLVSDPTGVFRVAGVNRYETSALLTSFVAKWVEVTPGVWDTVPPDTAIISTGLTFADALAGGAAGGWEYAPLLLTATGGLDRSVIDTLTPFPGDPGAGFSGQKYTTVRILGSTATVSAAVANQIQGILPDATIVRYAGSDRFDTAARLNADVFDGAYEVTLTNGFRFPDALAGAPRVNVTGGPTIPVRTDCIPAFSQGTITALAPSFITALGNVDAVSAAALNGTTC